LLGKWDLTQQLEDQNGIARLRLPGYPLIRHHHTKLVI